MKSKENTNIKSLHYPISQSKHTYKPLAKKEHKFIGIAVKIENLYLKNHLNSSTPWRTKIHQEYQLLVQQGNDNRKSDRFV